MTGVDSRDLCGDVTGVGDMTCGVSGVGVMTGVDSRDRCGDVTDVRVVTDVRDVTGVGDVTGVVT